MDTCTEFSNDAITNAARKVKMYIATEGFVLCGLKIPRFVLNSGKGVRVAWPEPMGGRAEKIFYEIMTGVKCVDAMTLNVKAAIATPHTNSLRSSSLSEVMAICPSDAGFLLFPQNDLTENDQTKLGDLPLVVRSIAALALAAAKSKVVVLSLDGLDPLGELKVMEYIQAKINNGWSFVLMSYPCLHEVPSYKVVISEISG